VPENIKVQVFALRNALGEDRDFILTEHGRGYRFVAECYLERISAPTAATILVSPKAVSSTERSASASWLVHAD
jgi:DNA-binding winged helix-turn-helix (wHTH) protein